MLHYLSLLKIDIPLDMHRRPSEIILIHGKVHIRHPRHIPPLNIHTSIWFQRRPHQIIFPQFSIPCQWETPISANVGGYHILVVEFLGYCHPLIVLQGGHFDKYIIGIVCHYYIAMLIINMVLQINRHLIPIIIKSLCEFQKYNSHTFKVLPSR